MHIECWAKIKYQGRGKIITPHSIWDTFKILVGLFLFPARENDTPCIWLIRKKMIDAYMVQIVETMQSRG